MKLGPQGFKRAELSYLGFALIYADIRRFILEYGRAVRIRCQDISAYKLAELGYIVRLRLRTTSAGTTQSTRARAAESKVLR